MQFEGVLRARIVRRPGFGDVRHRLAVLVGGQQRVINQAPDLERKRTGRALRIERVDVAVARPDDVFCMGRDAEGTESRGCRECPRQASECDLHLFSPCETKTPKRRASEGRCRRTQRSARPEIPTFVCLDLRRRSAREVARRRSSFPLIRKLIAAKRRVKPISEMPLLFSGVKQLMRFGRRNNQKSRVRGRPERDLPTRRGCSG